MPDPNGSAIRVSRPTITIDGEDKPTLIERLLSLEIVERVEGLYRLEAAFGNLGPADNQTGFLFFDRQTIDFGKTVKVKLESDTIFEGRISGIEAEFPDGDEPKILILAEDKFQDLRMKRRTRTFDDMSDSDIAGRIAGDHGLTPDVSMSGPTHKVVAQVNQSDLAFLRERARNVDAELWMDGSTLHVQSHSARGGQPFQLSYGSGPAGISRTCRPFTSTNEFQRERVGCLRKIRDRARGDRVGHQQRAQRGRQRCEHTLVEIRRPQGSARARRSVDER